MLQSKKMKAPLQEKVILKTEAKKRLSEKAARAEKAAQIWDNHPLFKGELSALNEAKVRQNQAINLTNQARFMKQLNEQETSAEFQRMAPANVMKLVQMTMTNLNRGNVFSEYAMETARDAIYYIKPYFSKSAAADAGNFAERSMSFDAAKSDQDPYGFDANTVSAEREIGGYNGLNPAYGGKARAANGAVNTNARKSIYESKESRFANELANTANVTIEGNTITVEWKGGPFGENGEFYVPGSTKIYVGTDERNVIAFQDPSDFSYYIGQKFAGATAKDEPRASKDGVVKTVITLPEGAEVPASVNAYGRFESETDYTGKNLGDVNLYMSVYELRPRRTSVGVSWTKLAEITLDSTFNTQVDDLLLSAAADVIHGQIDLQAFKDAYAIACTNPAFYTVEFDAAYATGDVPSGSAATKDSYVDIANTFPSAIELAGAALYSDIHRGAINKLVVGVSVAPYLKLMAGFTPKGIQDPTGVYKIGELDGIEVFKAPIEVIPDNEVLCVFKNTKVENDVALVFGTLVPFVSNKLEYPTFNTRAGLATFGDKALLNPKYLSRIIINHLKDRIKEDAYKATAGF
jgi:hypothetical protein